MTLAIPRNASDVTTEWLSEIFNAPVDSVRIDDIGAGVGIFGIVLRVHCTSPSTDVPATAIVKLPTDAEANLAIGLQLRLYEREIRVYADLAPRLPIHVPRCYYAGSDPSTNAYVLVVEDLVGLSVGDQLVGITLDRAQHVIDELASLHASMWDSAELRAATWLPTLADPIYAAAVPPIYHSAWPVIRNTFADIIEPEAAAIGDRLDEVFEEILARCDVGPHTLVHSDVRLDNLFFDDQTGAVTFIDFQLSLRGRGVLDVCYLLATSMDPDDQDAYAASLVERYHTALVRNGVTGYSLEECWRHYREHALYILVGAASIGGTFDTGNERGAALARAYIQRCMHHVVAVDAARVF